LSAWPKDTPDIVNHKILNDYIQGIAKETGVDDLTLYNTSVQSVTKNQRVWKVLTKTLTDIGFDKLQFETREWVRKALRGRFFPLTE
jgi:hypothetical protein